MSCFLQTFKAQNIFEIKLVEVGDYNSTNQDPQYLKWLLKGIFLTLKKFQSNWKKIAHEPWSYLFVLNQIIWLICHPKLQPEETNNLICNKVPPTD